MEYYEAAGDGIVSPLGLLDILRWSRMDSGLFHTAGDLQPLQIGVLKHADAARQPLHKRQQALLVIKSQCRSGHIQP